ncbi:choloylglycine hydrolase family protein [bacterium]|nr:choloylglycine hydrolase family protein [bacterium]
MCTAATYKTNDFYFGRTLDYEHSYGEQIVITPREYPFHFRKESSLLKHYAIIGMATCINDYPLYFDGCNEKGLCMAGLNFVGNACYFDFQEGKINIAQYEFIPYILSTCATVKEAKALIEKINLLNVSFSKDLSVAELHYMISDETESITIEPMKDGIKIFDNPVGVLTNNPPFDYQLFQLNNYLKISPKDPKNQFSKDINLKRYSRGMGGIGLPGDLSSSSRFVRACFVKMNSLSLPDEESSVSQFFHILNFVDQPRGCCEVTENAYEITIYTSCMNATKGIYYYTTYDNHQISAVHLHHVDLNQKELIKYPLIQKEQMKSIN